MKYKIINNKKYEIEYLKFKVPSGESIIDCTKLEADILASSNGFILEPIKKDGENINLLKKK